MEELKKGNNQFSEIAREYGVSRQYVFQLHKEQKLKEI
jgi:DNA-directed RNA polymerase specialized sigma subunit